MSGYEESYTLLGVNGPVEVTDLDEEERRLGQAHLRAVLDYVEHAETRDLHEVERQLYIRYGAPVLAGVPLVFDPYVIYRLASKGAIDFESIYES